MTNVAQSVNAVMHVARAAVLRGKDVAIPGMRFAKSYEEWDGAADEGFDLTVENTRINVKQSRRDFNSVDEFAAMFPGRSRPILVCATHAKGADFYLILNRARTGAISIPENSKPHWGVRSGVFDPRYGTQQDCYDVASERVAWMYLGDEKKAP